MKIKMGLRLRVAARRAMQRNRGRKKPISMERILALLQYARRPR